MTTRNLSQILRKRSGNCHVAFIRLEPIRRLESEMVEASDGKVPIIRLQRLQQLTYSTIISFLDCRAPGEAFGMDCVCSLWSLPNAFVTQGVTKFDGFNKRFNRL